MLHVVQQSAQKMASTEIPRRLTNSTQGRMLAWVLHSARAALKETPWKWCTRRPRQESAVRLGPRAEWPISISCQHASEARRSETGVHQNLPACRLAPRQSDGWI